MVGGLLRIEWLIILLNIVLLIYLCCRGERDLDEVLRGIDLLFDQKINDCLMCPLSLDEVKESSIFFKSYKSSKL